jgi:hypothetical protein
MIGCDGNGCEQQLEELTAAQADLGRSHTSARNGPLVGWPVLWLILILHYNHTFSASQVNKHNISTPRSPIIEQVPNIGPLISLRTWQVQKLLKQKL